jgi:hypothetical protein
LINTPKLNGKQRLTPKAILSQQVWSRRNMYILPTIILLNTYIAPNMKDFIVIDKELMRGLSEKEVELEHLKTVIVGLNEKLQVKEDIEEDLFNAR